MMCGPAADIMPLLDFASRGSSHFETALKRIEKEDHAVSHRLYVEIWHDRPTIAFNELRHPAAARKTNIWPPRLLRPPGTSAGNIVN
jgi:hypothetical protein